MFSEARPAYCLLCKSGRPPVLFSSLGADSVGAAAARARAPQTPAPPRSATQRLIPGLQRLRRRRRLQRREGRATPPRSVRGVCPGCVVVARVIPAVAVAHAACGTSRTALCTRQGNPKENSPRGWRRARASWAAESITIILVAQGLRPSIQDIDLHFFMSGRLLYF